jgi:hypothetical protein
MFIKLFSAMMMDTVGEAAHENAQRHRQLSLVTVGGPLTN